MDNRFNLAGLGGTFDRLHQGHKLLLRTAFKIGKRVAIGLTTDEMLRNKEKKEIIESYEQRKQNILNYIKTLNSDFPSHCFIEPLKDSSGSAVTDPEIDVHISSEETIMISLKINEEREKRGLKKMILVAVPIVKDVNGEKISSTQIRNNLDE